MAHRHPTARTGVYFFTRDLALALAAREDVQLSLLVAPSLYRELAIQVAGTPLAACLRPIGNPGIEPLAVLSPFHVLHPGVYRTPGVKVFQVVHDVASHATGTVRPQALAFEKEVVKSIGPDGHLFCVSQTTRADVAKHFGVPHQRMDVVYPGVRTDIERGEVLNISWTGLAPETPYVLSLSTIEPRKNHATALRAFVDACHLPGGENLHFLIAGARGWGEDSPGMDQIPQALRSRIHPLGYVSDARLPGLIAGAHCLLYPSLYEGFGLPMLEAMARGTPVIASNAGSLPEVAASAAPLFEPLDHLSMARTIARWLRDPAERQAWAQRGLQRAAAFSWESSAETAVGAMRRVMQGRAS